MKLTTYQGVEMMFNTGLWLAEANKSEICEFDIGILLHLLLKESFLLSSYKSASFYYFNIPQIEYNSLMYYHF